MCSIGALTLQTGLQEEDVLYLSYENKVEPALWIKPLSAIRYTVVMIFKTLHTCIYNVMYM